MFWAWHIVLFFNTDKDSFILLIEYHSYSYMYLWSGDARSQYWPG